MNETNNPRNPIVALFLLMPVKKVRNDNTKVEKAVRRKMKLLSTRTEIE